LAKPQIIFSHDPGAHNSDLEKSASRLKTKRQYKDTSTICIIPTRGMIHAKVVQSWWNMQTPMNGRFMRMMPVGMEVGEAYNSCIEMILDNPELSTWKYVLTLEEDNIPPWDGLLKLHASIDGRKKYDAMGGLYWTKGDEGQPMIYGDPKEPVNFMPQIPLPDQIQECHGLGMGFTLFRLDVFRKLDKPWFKTVQEQHGQGTQDLYAFANMRRLGMRVACDTSIKVGHYDSKEDVCW
jgi:hypothetical protein